MGEVKDKNGTPITIGDSIRIGSNRYALVTKIDGFTTMDGGTQLIAKTKEGDFDVTIVEKI